MYKILWVLNTSKDAYAREVGNNHVVNPLSAVSFPKSFNVHKIIEDVDLE